MVETNIEKRNFTRIVTDAPAQLQCPDQTLSVKLLDISLKGVLLDIPEEVAIELDAVCRLTLTLGEESISVELQQVHSDTNRRGFTITHIDLDSIIHLRRLVELNLGNPEELERELADLIQPGC